MTLTITDDKGATDSYTATVTVVNEQLSFNIGFQDATLMVKKESVVRHIPI